jgi:hypothetical protein
MSEQLADFVVKSIKEFNKEKSVNSKKLIDFGFKYQHEFLETYDELNKVIGSLIFRLSIIMIIFQKTRRIQRRNMRRC